MDPGQAAGRRRDVERRPLPRVGHHRRRSPPSRRRPPVRAGHVQRLGHPHAFVGSCVLQPVELSPRQRLGGRTGDDPLWPAAVRLRRARARSRRRAVRSRACSIREYRIPECVGGYARGERPTPGAYPQANTPQLWNATAFPLVVQTLLGIAAAGADATAHDRPGAARLAARDLSIAVCASATPA